MKTFRIMLAAAIAVMAAASCSNEQRLPRASAEVQEEIKADCDSFFVMSSGRGTDIVHSMMVLKDGKVAYERYAPGHSADELHILWSASKTFTSTAIGFAVQDGLLSVDDKVLSFFEEEAPASELQSEWLKDMTVKDLLIMSSGLSFDIINKPCRDYIPDWTREILSYDMAFEPGSKYAYNSGNTYLLSAIITKVTGLKTSEYIEQKLFKPLGIKDYWWEEAPNGITAGGWGLFLKLEDFAKMGQFLLQEGEWNGVQLLNPEWIAEATSAHIYQNPALLESGEDLDDWHSGYCYQIWRCRHGYRLDGAKVQICLVLPEKNAVVAFFSCHGKKQALWEILWEQVYPVL